ncbi:FAD-dependent monooxygenase [Marinicellulosiphila megalodicopiae]|uniref:FAD-dependent monooxygenase n=1 Tax=Marinicellulosiphila megalodicopiae TaxID=2724896 RepID=UPI003BAEB97E
MIVINGAGIAGLTLANALLQKGIPFKIIERSISLEAMGAGIILQNNGLAILDKLGLVDEIKSDDIRSLNLGYKNHITQARADKIGLKCKAVHRAELQTILLKNIPKEMIILNAEIESIQNNDNDNDNGLVITLNNGEHLKADYLVNGAGINNELHAKAEIHDTGLMCWRAVVTLKSPLQQFGEYWFGKQRIGMVALSDSKAYVFHVVQLNSDEDINEYNQSSRQAFIKTKSSNSNDFHQLNFENTQWIKHPLQDRKINWGHNRIIAIGDAAHAMTPNLGQGAVLAMEDAMELAYIFSKQTNNPVAELIKQRHSRIKSVHKLSRLFGQIAHNEYFVFKLLKIIMVKFMPNEMLMKSQVKWMNQFVNRLEVISK